MLLLSAAGCGRSDASRPIPRERFVRLYAGILYAAELHRGDPPAYRLALDSLFRAYDVDSAAVSRTVTWYARHPKDLTALYQQVVSDIERHASRRR